MGGNDKMSIYYEDINKHSWKVKNELKIDYNRLETFENVEQECHFNILRASYINEKVPEILVCCSYQNYITILAKSEFFKLEEVLLSTHINAKNRILQVTGRMPIKALTVRKKIPQFSEKEKEIRRQRLKSYNSKKE